MNYERLVEEYKFQKTELTRLNGLRKTYSMEVAELRETLEDLYSMASSPQWRNEPLYRICELLEKALEQHNDS